MPGKTVEGPGEVRCRQCGEFVPWQNGYLAPHEVHRGVQCTGSHSVAPPPRVRVPENDVEPSVDLGVTTMPTLDEHARPYGGVEAKPGIVYGDEFEATRRARAGAALTSSTLAEHVESHLVRPVRCPTCGSPDPARHPAMQHEGEVQPCLDPWHQPEPVPTKDRPGDRPLSMTATREALVPVVSEVIDRRFGVLFREDARHQQCDEMATEVVDAIIETFADGDAANAPE